MTGPQRLCNGCYGLLLSLYEIKSGTNTDNERAEALAAFLFEMAASEDVAAPTNFFVHQKSAPERLSAEASRFIATAEFVASQLMLMQLESGTTKVFIPICANK